MPKTTWSGQTSSPLPADKTVMDIFAATRNVDPFHAFGLNNVREYHDPHTRFKSKRTETGS
jgi:hypothetical protein